MFKPRKTRYQRKVHMHVFIIRLWGVLFSVVSLAAALSPVWIYLVVRIMANPNGFWQELALGVAGFWIMGMVQLAFLVVWIMYIIFYWSDTVEARVRRVRRRQLPENSDY